MSRSTTRSQLVLRSVPHSGRSDHEDASTADQSWLLDSGHVGTHHYESIHEKSG